MFSNRHIISVNDFQGFEKRIEMALSTGRKLETQISWDLGVLVEHYIVTIGDKTETFYAGQLAAAIRHYNEE